MDDCLVFETELGRLYCGDCLDVMKGIRDGSVDMVLADLPYGMTDNEWDSRIPLKPLWKQYKRVLKEKGVIVLTAIQPFSSMLVVNDLKMFKYEWIWIKERGTGFLNAKKQPLRAVEHVLVFYNQQPTYNPQMRKGKPYIKKGHSRTTNYNFYDSKHITVNSGKRYPLNYFKFDNFKEYFRANRNVTGLHPTQKPLKLFEYLIKTYTNEGDLVLDNVIGSGTTAVACENLNRRWIGIEKKKKYCDITINRLKKILDQTKLKRWW